MKGKRLVRLSLRLKVLLFTMTIIVILLIISHLITSTLVAQNLEEQLRLRAKAALENFNVWRSVRLEKLYDRARLLANSPWLIDACQYPDLFDLRDQLRANPVASDIEALLVESTYNDWSFQIVDRPDEPQMRIPARRDLFERELGRGGSRADFIGFRDRILLAVSVPITNDGSEIGVLTAGAVIDQSILEELIFSSGSDQLHIISGDSLILTTFDGPEAEQLIREWPAARDQVEAVYLRIGSEQYLTRAQPLEAMDQTTVGYIVVQFSDRQSRELLANISNALNLSAFGAFIVFILISVVFTGRITDNLQRLVRHIGALAEGRYEEEIAIASRDEVGLLARSFEDLRLKLRDRTSALVEANQDLDQRIREIVGLNSVMVAIASNMPMREVLGVIAREAGARIPVDYAFLALKEARRGSAMRLLAHAVHGDDVPGIAPLDPGANRAEALIGRETILLTSVDADSPYSDVRWMAERGLVTACYLPLRSEGNLVGALCLAARSDQTPHLHGTVTEFLERLATEITVALQRLRLNEELQVIEDRFKRLFDSARDGIFQTDAQGNILFLNAAAQRMFGAESGAAGLQLSRLLLKPQVMQQLLDQLAEKGYVSGFAATMHAGEGRTFEAELSVNYTEDQPGQRGIEGIVRDVTVRKQLERELQRSEGFLRQVIEGTTNAIFTLDAEGRISFMNRQLSDLSGIRERSLRGKALPELFDAESVVAVDEMLSDVLERKHATGSHEVKIRRSDGSLRIGLLSLAPLRRQGEDRVAVGAIADITEIKKLEDQLIRSERLASMGQIAAGVAHEINNPLGIILGFTQDLLAEKEIDDPDREPLQTIEQETRRCARTVKDLLDLARAESVVRKQVALGALIERTVPLFKIYFRDERIQPIVHLGGTPEVSGDEHQLQQILMNVILNAVHAMRERGGMLGITLSAAQRLADRQTVVLICIADTGEGIEPAHLSRIFDPFYTTRRGGSGLGLFIVHRLVEAHGGAIAVESRPGSGTLFTITFPAAEALT